VRAIWKGHLRLSLVTIPIRVFPATNAAATIHFHQLHRTCQTRIQYKKWCPHDHVEVANDEIVKGYEFERGRYVVIEDKEIEKVRPESTRVVNLSQIVDAKAIDPIFYEEPYFLSPGGKPAAESFAVLRDALQGKAAIGTVAFHGRERLVAIESRESGLSMFTLRRRNEIRSISAVSELEDVPRRTKAEEVSLAKKVMASFERTSIDFSKYPDTYEEALRKMIDRKVAGEEIVEPAEPEAPAKVVNLMDALKKSLDEVSAHRKRPAKAPMTMVRQRKSSRVTRAAARRRA
jgi:DNA end-binding protein Ku